MRTIGFPRTADTSNLMPRQINEERALSDKDFDVLLRLIEHHRLLPLHFGRSWRCYECRFKSNSLSGMWTHIMVTHESAPAGQGPSPGEWNW